MRGVSRLLRAAGTAALVFALVVAAPHIGSAADDDKSVEELKKELAERLAQLKKMKAGSTAWQERIQAEIEYMQVRETTSARWPWVVSPDGKQIAAGTVDGTVEIWPATGGAPERVLTGHARPVTFVAFHPTKPVLFSGSRAGSMRAWDLETGKRTAMHGSKDHKTIRPMLGLSLSDDGRFLCAGMWDVGVQVLDTTHDVWRPGAVNREEGDGLDVTYLPGGKLAVVRSSDAIRVLDIQSASEEEGKVVKPKWTLRAFDEVDAYGKERTKLARKLPLEDGVQAMRVYRAKGMVMTACLTSREGMDKATAVAAWDLRTGKRKFRATTVIPVGRWAHAPEATVALYIAEDAVHMFSLGNGRRVRKLPHPKSGAPHGFSADGKQAYYVDDDGNLEIRPFP